MTTLCPFSSICIFSVRAAAWGVSLFFAFLSLGFSSGSLPVALKKSLEGHQHWVSSLSFSPDGKILASGSYDKTVKVWDVETGALRETLEGHRGAVYAVAFSPDGLVLASSGEDMVVVLWNAGRHRPHRLRLGGHQNRIRTVAFSPDGKMLASGSDDKTVNLWDVESGMLKQTLRGHVGAVMSVAFSPDGKILASAGARVIGSGDITDRTVKLWDVETGKLMRTLEDRSGVFAVAFSPDGKLLASATDRVSLWDVQTGVLKQTLNGHSQTVTSLAFSPDGKILVSGSMDRTVKLWNPQAGLFQKLLKQNITNAIDQTKKGLMGVFTVRISPNGKTLASGGFDNKVKLWDLTAAR